MVVTYKGITGIVHAVGDVGTHFRLRDLGTLGDADADGLVLVSRKRDIIQAIEAGREQVGAAEERLGSVLVHMAVTGGLPGRHDADGRLEVKHDLAPKRFSRYLRKGRICH